MGLTAAIWLDELRSGYLCQSEIKDLGVATLGDENIGGLDVAVNDAFGVRGVKRIGNLNAERQARSRCPRAVPAMRCFSVTPSRNSMAMKAYRLLRRCRRWCRY